MSSSKTREPTPEAAELTSQVKKGSHSPELRAVAVNTRPRPAPDSLWRLMRVIDARIDHACATLDKSRRRDQPLAKVGLGLQHPALLPTGLLFDCGRSIRVVTPHPDMTGDSSPQAVDPHLAPGLLHGKRAPRAPVL